MSEMRTVVGTTVSAVGLGAALLMGAADPFTSLSPFTSFPQAFQSPSERGWPQWRGPHGTGVSRTATPPIEWSETKNVRWKVEVPGRGSATPVVWGDRLYRLTAIPSGVSGEAQHAAMGGRLESRIVT